MTHQIAETFQNRLKKLVLGQEALVENLTICLLCRGHALLTGFPGLAKTRLVQMAGYLLNQDPKRIQFTPDLTPFDLLGGETLTYEKNAQPTIRFLPGPLFHPLIIADEINRASPRTQSALLEAMQERQITTAGETHPLPKPFLVFATQNPLEQEGTFPLPEAQLDRFLLELNVDYPDATTEKHILELSPGLEKWEKELPQPIEKPEKLWNAFDDLKNITVKEELKEAIVRFVRETRPETSSLKLVQTYLKYGASPRASQAFYLTLKARALLKGKTEAQFEDLLHLAPFVLQHRIGLSLKAHIEELTALQIIEEIKKEASF